MKGVRCVHPQTSRSLHSQVGQLLNEEGLPIVEITEPISSMTTNTVSHIASQSASSSEVHTFTEHVSQLSQEGRAQERATIDQFFDELEAEEELEEAKNAELEQLRLHEEYERRKANAAKELERLCAATAMQKKLGKALLRGLSENSSTNEPILRAESNEDSEEGEHKGSKLNAKKVTFSESVEEKPTASRSRLLSSSSGLGTRPLYNDQPMKFQVVERTSTKPAVASLNPSHPEGDSDDDSIDGLPDSHDGDEDGEVEEDPVLQDETDFDDAQHQREIALAYYEKRATVGQDTARAMAAHSHEPIENEWDQPVWSPFLYITFR
jgi:hypothetical protein